MSLRNIENLPSSRVISEAIQKHGTQRIAHHDVGFLLITKSGYKVRLEPEYSGTGNLERG